MRPDPGVRRTRGHGRSAGPGLLVSWLLLLLVALRIQRWTGAPPIPIGAGAARALSIVFLMGWVFGVFWTILTLPPTRSGAALVTTGPFGRVRHPLYAISLFFLGLLTIASSRSWIVAAAWPLTYAVAHLWARFEERGLEEAFGERWRAYAAVTPRFLPRGKGVAAPGVPERPMPDRSDPG